MEAPKKIYIDDFGSELSFDWHTEHSYEKDIEYIRKDVFIERACKFISRRVFNCAEGNIIEDFKKYMND